MLKRFNAAILLCLLFVVTVSAQSDPNLGIIPAPNSVIRTGGEFKLSPRAGILFENEGDKRIAELFSDFLKEKYALDIPAAKNFIQAPQGIIRFTSSAYKGKNPEGYSIVITPREITVSGKGSGLFYGLQSLMQLFLEKKHDTLRISCAVIEDAPRYVYRGMHLDVVRHMFPLSFIKKYIDLLAQYKLNTFHWHLTDDQGWRIEIKKYPMLTSVGGFRAQTLIGNYHDRMPQWFDHTPYGGYYTQDEVREVVQYAADRYITVIPEIEMPGHAVAALAAYPELACGDNPGPFKVEEKWGIFPDVFCAGKEHTFHFLEDVLTEVIALFPSTYIHIGGDECPKIRWKACKYCQKRIRDNKLKDEQQLQSYFIHRIEKYLNSKGRQIIGWDEILEGGLAPNATVMSWRGTAGGIAAAKLGHNVVMTPGNIVYFDQAQGNSIQEPLTINGYSPLQKVYAYNPTPSNLTPQQQQRIIGVQATAWTEYMTTPQKVEYMVLPRLYALSEIAWTLPSRKDYTNFLEERLPVHLARLDSSGTVYRVPEVIGLSDTTLIGGRFSFTLKSSVKGGKIYYTIDGYTPGETDYLYDKPIQIFVPEGERRVLQAVVITPGGKRSVVTKTILNNELPLAPVAARPLAKGLNYYLVPNKEFRVTAEIDTLQASEKGVTSKIDLSKFSGKGRTYGAVFTGYINIAKDGTYIFSILSDDGSALWIDGQLVLDNDQKHFAYERPSAVRLLKGFHKIEIRYFQAGGSSQLKVYMKMQGNAKEEIPAGALFH